MPTVFKRHRRPRPTTSGRLRAAAALIPLCFASAAHASAQQLGTIEGAVLVREGVLRYLDSGGATTFGAQLSLYLARPLALEADGSVGTVEVGRLNAATRGGTIRPVAVRAVYMPNPWGDTRALAGLGYTWYTFTLPQWPGANRGAPTLTAGLQHDVARARLRLDADLLRLEEGSAPDGSQQARQIEGALRLSVGLRAPRLCCP